MNQLAVQVNKFEKQIFSELAFPQLNRSITAACERGGKEKCSRNGSLESFNGENGLAETKRNSKNPLLDFSRLKLS
jgi:hypothetical protein